MGAISPSRWQLTQFLLRIGATSLEKVGVLLDCALSTPVVNIAAAAASTGTIRLIIGKSAPAKYDSAFYPAGGTRRIAPGQPTLHLDPAARVLGRWEQARR